MEKIREKHWRFHINENIKAKNNLEIILFICTCLHLLKLPKDRCLLQITKKVF